MKLKDLPLNIRTRLIDGMGRFAPDVMSAWGMDFEPFLTYIAYATATAEYGLSRLESAVIADPESRSVILGGEYSCGSLPDGSDSISIKGSIAACHILRKRGIWQPTNEPLRDLRGIKGGWSIVFSGAVHNNEKFGNIQP